MRANDVELAVSRDFDIRQNIIVPNVYWGIRGLDYEADLVVLRPSGYAIEIEIKVTAADIRADLKKQHAHGSKLFKELWFAAPAELSGHRDIPARAGIISIEPCKSSSWQPNGYVARRIRVAQTNKSAVKWSEQRRLELCRLATMRVWSLKAHLARKKTRHKG